MAKSSMNTSTLRYHCNGYVKAPNLGSRSNVGNLSGGKHGMNVPGVGVTETSRRPATRRGRYRHPNGAAGPTTGVNRDRDSREVAGGNGPED